MIYDKADVSVLISMPRAGSHYIGDYIRQGYRKHGMVGPEIKSSEFFSPETYDQSYLKKIKLFEDIRDTFGLDMFSIFHSIQLYRHVNMPSKPHYTYLFDWFKDFYHGYRIALLRRRNIWKHFVSFTFHNIIAEQLRKYGKEDGQHHSWHFMSATDDDVLKSTIQEYNIKFKFDDRHLEFFLMQIRFFNEHIASYYKTYNTTVYNLWLEECTHEDLLNMFVPEKIKDTYKSPFIPSKIKYLPYFENTTLFKAKFMTLYESQFKPYGYLVD